MKTYELLLVLDNAIADDAKEAAVKKFEEVIVKAGGSVASVDKWGARKLAYPINYKTDGYYVLVTFEAESASIKELDRVVGLSQEVIRRLITIKTSDAPVEAPKAEKAEKAEKKSEKVETVEVKAEPEAKAEETAAPAVEEAPAETEEAPVKPKRTVKKKTEEKAADKQETVEKAQEE